MKISYDKQGDSLLIQFLDVKVSKDEQIGPNTFAAYSRTGELVEIQILDISEQSRPWMTLEAAAVYLQKSNRTVERWIKDGKLKAAKIGGQFQIQLKDIEKFSKAA